METIQNSQLADTSSKKAKIAGQVIRVVCILFLLFDAIMKLIRERHSISGTVELGWSDQSVQLLGGILLVATLIYIYPKTSVFGAILLTGYLGGATATMLRVGVPCFFPVIFGVFVWLGLFLTNKQLLSTFWPNKKA